VFTRARRSTSSRLLTIVFAAAAALTLCGTSSAQAAPPAGLPPLGSELHLGWDGAKVPLVTRFGVTTVDLTGDFTARIDSNPDDPINSVLTRLTGFRGTGQLPDARDGRQGGTITIEQNDVDVDTKSLLRLTQRFPPKFEQIMVLSFTMTIDNPESLPHQAGFRSPVASEPLVLITEGSARLVGNLTSFPPTGSLYQLREPIKLGLKDHPNVTIAQLNQFPVTVGQI